MLINPMMIFGKIRTFYANKNHCMRGIQVLIQVEVFILKFQNNIQISSNNNNNKNNKMMYDSIQRMKLILNRICKLGIS